MFSWQPGASHVSPFRTSTNYKYSTGHMQVRDFDKVKQIAPSHHFYPTLHFQQTWRQCAQDSTWQRGSCLGIPIWTFGKASIMCESCCGPLLQIGTCCLSVSGTGLESIGPAVPTWGARPHPAGFILACASEITVEAWEVGRSSCLLCFLVQLNVSLCFTSQP